MQLPIDPLLLNSVEPLVAYIGPGLGGGVIAVILGFIASIFLAIFAIFWYPIKRMLGIKSKPKPKKQKPVEPSVAKAGEPSDPAAGNPEGEASKPAESDRPNEK